MAEDRAMHSGNLFFKHKYTSIDIESAIDYIDSFEEFEKMYTDELIEGNVLLRDYLDMLMRRYKTNAQQLASDTGWHYDYFRKVLRGERDNPSRDFLLAICVHIRATVEETRVLLQYAGQQPLYARKRRDALIWYALRRKQGLTALDTYLADHGYDLLTKIKKDEE